MRLLIAGCWWAVDLVFCCVAPLMVSIPTWPRRPKRRVSLLMRPALVERTPPPVWS